MIKIAKQMNIFQANSLPADRHELPLKIENINE